MSICAEGAGQRKWQLARLVLRRGNKNGSNIVVNFSMRHLILTQPVCAAEFVLFFFLSVPKIQNVITGQEIEKGRWWTMVCLICLTDSLMSLCAFCCGDDLQSSQREMDAHPIAKCARVPHVKQTADLCPSLDSLGAWRAAQRADWQITSDSGLLFCLLVNNGYYNIFFLSVLKHTQWLFSKVAVTPAKPQKTIRRSLGHLDWRSAEADETRARHPTKGEPRIRAATT